MGKTSIEWCSRLLPDGTRVPGYTKNIAWGCVKVSEGCKNCYADTFATRVGLDLWGPSANRRTFGDAYWRECLRWNAEAQKQGHRRNVFCSSMADTFEEHPVLEEERQLHLWPTIEQTPWLNWLLLTKRPQNILSLSPWSSATHAGWPDTVWIGTSVENQRRAQERVPHLLAVPSVVRFLSVEPLLEPLDLMPWLSLGIHWVIVGGESGPHARPMQLDWVRALRDQCAEAHVAFFYKQFGGITPKAGGRDLDGRTWDAMPPEVPTRNVV